MEFPGSPLSTDGEDAVSQVFPTLMVDILKCLGRKKLVTPDTLPLHDRDTKAALQYV